MKKSKLIIIIFLLILSLGIYISNQQNSIEENTQKATKLTVPKIILPRKSIEFSIIKNRDKQIDFSGSFAKKETPMNFAKLLKYKEIQHQIFINSKLDRNQEVISLVEKILNIFSDKYREGSIIYKDRKLLISGKTMNQEAKEKIETLLTLSTVNCFSNIQLIEIQDEELIKKVLRKIITKRETTKTTVIPEDEAKDILSNLKMLRPREITEPTISYISRVEKEMKEIESYTHIKPIKKIVRREKKKIKKKEKIKITKVKEKKREIKKKKVIKIKKPVPVKTPKPEKIIIYKKIYIEKPIDKWEPTITAEEYQANLKLHEPDKEITALQMVEKLDMNIEEKILKTPKPLIEKETIYIPSKEKNIDQNIPWAKLHEMEEKVEGILIKENI